MRRRSLPTPWWGDGEPPHERWPGVTLDFRATYSTLRDRWETHNGAYYFDTQAADDICDFFPLYLRHHIGEYAGEPFILRDDQAKLFARPMFGWKRMSDGMRRFRKVFGFCPKGYGKALALDTPIPTPTGWTTMAALQAGDQVVDERSQPCTVVVAHDVQVGRPCYRVGFDDGSSVVADADHLWFTQTPFGGPGVRTTQVIAETLMLTHSKTPREWPNHEIGTRRIVSCDQVPSVPVRCLTVDSPSHLYLAGPSMVPTHNSPLGAGFAIYLTRCDHEAAAEVYAVAADRDNARTVHDNAKIMIENSPDLYDGCEILKDSIVWVDLHSALKVLSADASTKHGFRPHGVIFDELHAQKNRDLYEALKKSMVKRRQPMMLIITHAGTDDEGIAFEEYDLAKRILGGSVDVDTTLPILFEMSTKDDWTDPEVWKRVNPGHGTTVKHDGIVEECQEALAEPRKRNDFLRYHGNRWTSQATAWIPIEWWDACQCPIDDAELLTLECAAGLDLAQKWDLACFCLTFRKFIEVPDDEEAIQVLAEDDAGAIVKKNISLNYVLTVRPFFWIPEDTMRQHEKEDGVPYSIWAETKSPGSDISLVTPTEGAVIDYTRIYRDITNKILPRYPNLKQGTIGYDPAFATDLSTKLRDIGGLQIMEVLQNYKMISEPSQIVEALIKGKRVRQDGHRVMRWCWENAAVKTDDAKRIRPVKPRNPSKRMDGAVAMIMGSKVLSMQIPARPRWTGEATYA